MRRIGPPSSAFRVPAAIALAVGLQVGCVRTISDGGRADASRALDAYTQSLDGTAVSFEMVPVPEGRVTLPGESNQVACGPFWIGATEVTWDAYDVFVYGLDAGDATAGADAVTRPSKPYVLMDRGFGHAGYPVISVSHHGAEQFCRWLSTKTGRRYRLPTEAEWRSVCERAAIDAGELDTHAWHRGNAESATHPVGTREPDDAGLHDLYGNAWEWCDAADGKPIVMGGSYRQAPDELGCAARKPASDAWNASDPQFPKSIWWLADGGFIGFRVVCDPDPESNGAAK